MLKHISALTLAFVFLLVQSWQTAAGQKMLEDISFAAPNSGEERVIFKLNGTYIPKVFTLQGKQPRIVFDFNNTAAAKTIKNTINTNGQLIRRIRVGIHKGPKTRVVLDLQQTKRVDIRQDFDEKKKILIVTIRDSSAGLAGLAAQTAEVPESEVPEKDEPAPEPETAPAPAASPEPPPAPVKQQKKQQQKTAADAEPEPASKQPETKPQIPAKTRTGKIASPELPTISSVTFENDSNRGEMVLVKVNEFHPPAVFGIEEGDPRVVCDFTKTVAAEDIPETIPTTGKYIRKIRVGKKTAENKVRVVLDLTPNYSYDLQQVFFKDESLFVLIINTLGSSPAGAL
ncbi:MAG: AMIN domain-containing protein [Candidatus Electrothrix sp. YB6]